MRKTILMTALCLLVMGGPAKAAQPAPAGPESIAAAIEQMRAAMLTAGPVLDGWRQSEDPAAALEKLGTDTHYFVIEDVNGQQVSILTSRRLDDFAPPSWRVVDSYGSPVAYAENPSLAFLPLGERYAIGGRVGQWRENGLDCSKGPTHAILYERTDSAAKEDAEAAIGMFRMTMLALEGQTICSHAAGNPQTGWRITALLPDGRSLPELNKDETRMRIVPAGPVDRLVKGKPLPKELIAPAE